jgi:hypothetical protein
MKSIFEKIKHESSYNRIPNIRYYVRRSLRISAEETFWDAGQDIIPQHTRLIRSLLWRRVEKE